MRIVRGIGVSSIGLIAVLLVGCGVAGAPGGTAAGGPQSGARPGVSVTTAKAASGPIAQVATYSGTVQASDSVNVVPKVSGRVTKLNVDVGSQVKAGDVIAELDKASLEAQVSQAQAGVDAAQVKLSQVQAGARPETVAAAAANAKAAASKLAGMQVGGRPEAIAQAKANLDAARAKLALVKAGPRTEAVAQAKANLDGAKAKLAQVRVGPTPEQIGAGQLTILQAQNALYAAQSSRDGICGNGRTPVYQCDAANAQVDAAQTALDQAHQQFKILTSPPTKEALDQAQAAIDAANQQYLLAQKPYTDQDVAQVQAAVDAAEQQYLLAQRPYTDQDIAQAQAAVDAAAAQARLAANPYTDLDVKAAQVAVDQAKAALSIVNSQLDEANVLAPFDGVVTAKLLSPGALAGTTTPIATIMSAKPQIQFAVEESRIGSVKTNQQVDLTSAAFPDKSLPATVTSVYPSADPKTHSFTVVVEPKDTGADLRAGMFVGLKLTLAAKDQAVLVPRAALVQQGNQPVVFVVSDGKALLRPVTVGLADDNNVEVVSGVTAGEEVVTAGQSGLGDNVPVRVAGSPSSAPAASPGGPGAQGGSTRPSSRPTATPSR